MDLLVLVPVVFVMVLLGALAVPSMILLLAAMRGRTQIQEERAPDGRLLILVPAHDEEMLIGGCLNSLTHSHDADRADVTVVADNCSDRTATIVRDLGFDCLERQDPLKKGKPFAIAWALEQLSLESYSAVAIVDADTLVDPSYCREILTTPGLPVSVAQPYNGIRNEDENWLTLLSGLLIRIRYEVTYPLKARAGMNVPLSNGLAIGREVLKEHGWTAFSVAEDLELYLQLTLAGYPVRYRRDAIVRSQSAKSLGQAGTQRSRWRSGRISSAVSRLREHERIKCSWLQAANALAEVVAPSPAIHGLLVAFLGAIGLMIAPPGLRVAVLLLAAFALSDLVGGLTLALAGHPRRTAVILALARLPGYALWRAWVELRVIVRGNRSQVWQRTARHSESDPPADP